jgi:diguanylate cyclase (GGDEF)-like protein
VAQALFALDAPRNIPRNIRIWQRVGVAAYFLIVGLAVIDGSRRLPALPTFALAHALIAAFVSAVTALLMFSHARSTGRRGFLWIGMTFLYMAGVLVIFPWAFPGAIVDGRLLLGNPQSALTLYYAWHMAFPVGLSVASWLLYSDRKTHRRPSLTKGQMWAAFGAVLAALSVTWLLVVTVPGGVFPELSDAQSAKAAAGVVADVVVLVLSLAFLAVAWYCSRTGSIISRWLTGMAMLAVGEALVSFTADSRYSVGWYFSRMLWLVAVSVLLVSLIWNLSRVDRANTQLATVDSLTGADSRLAFLGNVHREIARAQTAGGQVAMLWVDLDGFKAINDQLGHQVGDDVLREVVDRLAQQVRLTDHVGRLGGDEFGVLLCDYDTRDQVHKVAERLLAAVGAPIRQGDSLLHVTSAIGIATAPADATNAEDLLQCADLAMYAAKEGGGDTFRDFTPEIGTQAVSRAKTRQALSDAVRSRDFIAHYQPIYEADGLKMAGVEALVRWIRADEVLPAGDFVPFAENSGQIVPIGRILLQRVAADMPQWLEHGDEDFFVCMNLSVKELADRGLVDELLSGAMSHYAHRVVIEVTESFELQESSEGSTNIERIRDAGYRIAIDDFGAGFSNFTRLERLRPSLLKIDRALVRRAGSEVEGGVAFLTAATSVAVTLGCDVIAEGIQTQSEAQVVSLLGVRYVQGYRYARPGPIDQWLDAVRVP